MRVPGAYISPGVDSETVHVQFKNKALIGTAIESQCSKNYGKLKKSGKGLGSKAFPNIISERLLGQLGFGMLSSSSSSEEGSGKEESTMMQLDHLPICQYRNNTGAEIIPGTPVHCPNCSC